MIFDTQKQANSFVKDQLHYFDSKEDVINEYNLHSFVSNINLSDTNIEYRHCHFVIDLLVSNHGVVKDRDGSPIMPFTNDGCQWIKLKDDNGTWKKRKVSTLMVGAFSSGEAKRSSYRSPYKVNTLSNINYSLTFSPNTVIKRFEFESQDELDGLLFSHDIASIADVMEHFKISFDGYKAMTGHYSCKTGGSDTSIVTAEHLFNGVRYKVNNYGLIKQYVGGKWIKIRKPFIKKGRLIFRVLTDNSVREVGVAALIARAFGCKHGRIIATCIDGNPYNVCLRNLYWKGCGHKRYFDVK
jgi:hypothetical protein